MPPAPDLDALRAEALAAVERYAAAAFEAEPPFVPGESTVSVAGKVIGSPELRTLVDAALDGWLTEGRFADEFRTRLVGVTERPHVALVGSGSQANLLAVAASRSHLHERPLAAGDEVITPAVGFPTTVAPLYQHGLRPVYVDVEPDTYNPSLEAFAAAIGPRTRGILAAHCLGNPFDAPGLEALCREHDLVLIEDCCDALGSRIGGRLVGHVRPRRDLLVLSRAPHDDGGGGRGGDVGPGVGPRRRLAARVGPRLLVPARRQRRLRPPLRGPLRRAAGRLRPQVRLLARGLQLQAHRHAGRTRRGADAPIGKLRGAPAGELRAPARRVAAARGALRAAAGAAGARSRTGSATRSRCARVAPQSGAGCRCTCSSSASTRGSCWPAT